MDKSLVMLTKKKKENPSKQEEEDFPAGTVGKNHLSMQGIWVRFLDRGDSTSQSNYARVPQLLKPMGLAPVLRNRSRHNEKATNRNYSILCSL